MVPAATVRTTTVRFRTGPNSDTTAIALANADPNAFAEAHPSREFRWRAGQKHLLDGYRGPAWQTTPSGGTLALACPVARSHDR